MGGKMSSLNISIPIQQQQQPHPFPQEKEKRNQLLSIKVRLASNSPKWQNINIKVHCVVVLLCKI